MIRGRHEGAGHCAVRGQTPEQTVNFVRKESPSPTGGTPDLVSAALTAVLRVPGDFLPIANADGVLVGEVARADMIRAFEPAEPSD